MSDSPSNPITPAESDAVPPKVAPTPFAASPKLSATVRIQPVFGGEDPATKTSVDLKRPVIHKPGTVGKSSATMRMTGSLSSVTGPISPEEAADPKAASTMRMTGSLSSVTGPVPATAPLRRTGIVAEGVVTEAAKTKTSRISLNSAIGVAPTNAKSSTAPLKTIRLKRPTGLPAAPVAGAAQDNAASVTQKKTLKLHRPGGVQARPSLGIAKPADAAPEAAAPEVAAPVAEAAVPEMVKVVPVARKPIAKGVTVMSLITTIAATLVVGAVAYFLVVQGIGPTLDPARATDNDMQLIPTVEEYLPFHPFR